MSAAAVSAPAGIWRGRLRRHARLVAGTVVVAILVGLPAAWGVLRGTVGHGGPVTMARGNFASYPAGVGQSFSYGFPMVSNTSSHPVRLLSAQLLPPSHSGQAVITTLRVVPLNDGRYNPDLVGSWPDNHRPSQVAPENLSTTRPLAGYVVKPGGQAWIVFVGKVKAAGRTNWPRTEVSYQVIGGLFSGRTYVRTVSAGFSICAPANVSCPTL